MPKNKSPLLSLEAHGTIGNTLTFQGKGKAKVSRSKPILPFSLTLPQAYQRWLYEDYVAYWHTQTATVKQAYARLGTPYRLSGFAYWMKYHLTNLPDITHYFKLDSTADAVTPDSSRNSNDGTVIGASPCAGVIDRAMHFDGINDEILCGVTEMPTAKQEWSWIAFLKTAQNQAQIAMSFGTAGNDTCAVMSIHTDKCLVGIQGAGGNIFSGAGFADDNYHCLIATFTYTTGPVTNTLRFYVDDTYMGSLARPDVNLGDTFFKIGRQAHYATWFDGDVDHVILKNRVIDRAEISRWSERRYPS